MNKDSTDPDRISNLNSGEIKEAIRKKPDSGVTSMKIIGLIGCLGVVCSLIGASCYDHSIGVIPIIDNLASYGLFIGWAITVLVFILLSVSILVDLFRWRWKAVLYSVILFLIPLFSLAIISPLMNRVTPRMYCELCGKNLQKIGLVLDVYGQESEGRYPGLGWCDLLCGKFRLDPGFLKCGGVLPMFEGVSAYALNDQVVGKKRSELPTDIVVLFETDAEIKDPQYSMTEVRREILEDRDVESYQTDRIKEGQWNQVGGVDIVSCTHHAGLGSNILFADGHVEFVRKKDIPNLRWKPEGN